MAKTTFQKYRAQARISKISKLKPQIIQGTELRKGKVCKKEIMLIKYNDYMGFATLPNGDGMELTEMQLRVFEHLVNSAINGEMYVYGKDLLASARSIAWSIHSVFQHRPNWKKFIEATSRGFYRLKLYADEHKHQYKKCLASIENRKYARECV
jgi:hypothetical protein